MHDVVTIAGSPTDQGLAHGRAARALVHENIEVYFRRFAVEGGLDRATTLARADLLWRRMQDAHPDYAAMVRGVAEGAGADLAEIAALNVRYEILYSAFTERAMADGCTAFAALPEATANGHTLIGQNWDWIPEARGIVLHAVEPNGHARLCFTEAGIVGGKIGLNDAGLGLVINGMTSTNDRWDRDATPFHVRCWQVLGERSLEAAIGRIEAGERPCAANFLVAMARNGEASGGGVHGETDGTAIGDEHGNPADGRINGDANTKRNGSLPESAYDIETVPLACHRIAPDGGLLVHANNLLHAAELGAIEPPNPRRHLSIHRRDRLAEILEAHRGSLTAETLRTHLLDHDGRPNSVCRHPETDTEGVFPYETVTSVIMDLDERALWLSEGPPCTNGYRSLQLRGAQVHDEGMVGTDAPRSPA